VWLTLRSDEFSGLSRNGLEPGDAKECIDITKLWVARLQIYKTPHVPKHVEYFVDQLAGTDGIPMIRIDYREH
jgi:hypothetical protein